MKRRRHKLEVSTFPFLAVLLCAMGSLILVLLVMDRKARRAALSRAQQAMLRRAEEAELLHAGALAESKRRGDKARSAWEEARQLLRARLDKEKKKSTARSPPSRRRRRPRPAGSMTSCSR